MMRAVLPRIGGVAGQKKDDRSGKLSLLLVEFKYTPEFAFRNLRMPGRLLESESFDFQFSICNEKNKLMQYIASPSFLVLILSVHFPRIRGIAQHALDLVQDTDINEL
jgi:hypothetical protein